MGRRPIDMRTGRDGEPRAAGGIGQDKHGRRRGPFRSYPALSAAPQQ